MKYFTFSILFLCTYYALGADIYVNPDTGNDANPGTLAEPKKTISEAITAVSDSSNIWLMNGIYDSTTQGTGWYILIQDAQSKNITFKPYQGTDITLKTDNNYGCIRVYCSGSSKTYTFEDITFSFDTGNRFIYYDADKQLNLSFIDCVFDTLKDKPLIASDAVTTMPTREICFTRCTYTNTSNPYTMGFNDFALVYFDDCTLTNDYSNGSCRFFHLQGECAKFVLKNSTIFGKTNGFYPSYVTKVGKLIIQGNSFIHSKTSGTGYEYAIWIPDRDISAIRITGNTISYTNETTGLFGGICIGTALPGWTNTLYKPVVADNTITNARPGYYWNGIVFGLNVRGGSCFDNKIMGFKHGIYNAGEYSFIKGNTIKCTDGLVMWGGGYNNVWHNSVKSIDGYNDGRSIVFGRIEYFPYDGSHRVSNVQYTDTTAEYDGTGSPWDLSNVKIEMLALAGNALALTHWGIVTDIDDATDIVTVDKWRKADFSGAIETPNDVSFCIVQFSEHNTVLNNIFDSSQASFTITFDYNPRCGEDYIDYNCYQRGKYIFSNLGESFQYSLNMFQMKWASWSQVYPDNDAHSIEADPEFVDANNGDFRLKPSSPCLNAGKPTLNGGYTSMGAWQGISRSILLPDNCTEWLEMDFNSDCIVDFKDLDKFAQSWLECNLIP